MKILHYIQENRLAFWISLFYVILGGIAVCSTNPDDLLYSELLDWVWLITLPVNMISLAYDFTSGRNYFVIIIIQIVMFIPTFIIISKLIAIKRNK